MLERDYQTKLIKKIKKMLPGCFVLKNDSGYQQGIPDLSVFYRDRWGILEVKPEKSAPFRPNQEWFLEQMNEMSFAACIYPENEEEVLHALQQSLKSRRAARVPQR